MSNKTTMILTFIASVLLPFIQELVDFIEDLRNKGTTVQGLSVLVNDDLKKNSNTGTKGEEEVTISKIFGKSSASSASTFDTKEVVNGSRFLGNWRNL